jgi:type II secretory pathway pseudopilin PulG
MRMKRKHKKSSARGYLLLEVMVSGAVLAVMIGVALDQLVEARVQATMSAHRATAGAVARAMMDRITSSPFDTDCTDALDADGNSDPGTGAGPYACDPAGSCGTFLNGDSLTASHPGFTWQYYYCDVTAAFQDGGTLQSTPDLTDSTWRQVVVQVTYPKSIGINEQITLSRYWSDYEDYINY